MSPEFAVFILMNNYFHDVATAMLLACGIAMWLLLKQLEKSRDGSVVSYFARLSKGISRLAQFSIAWIIIGGIPRLLTFNSFEWANAVEKHHEAGVIAKYLIASAMMAASAYLWMVLRKKVMAILHPSSNEQRRIQR